MEAEQALVALSAPGYGLSVVAYRSTNRLGLITLNGNRRRTQGLQALAGAAECRR